MTLNELIQLVDQAGNFRDAEILVNGETFSPANVKVMALPRGIEIRVSSRPVEPPVNKWHIPDKGYQWMDTYGYRQPQEPQRRPDQEQYRITCGENDQRELLL